MKNKSGPELIVIRSVLGIAYKRVRMINTGRGKLTVHEVFHSTPDQQCLLLRYLNAFHHRSTKKAKCFLVSFQSF